MPREKMLKKILTFEIVDVKTKKVIYTTDVTVWYRDGMSQVRLGANIMYSEEDLVKKFIRTRWKEKKDAKSTRARRS